MPCLPGRLAHKVAPRALLALGFGLTALSLRHAPEPEIDAHAME